MGTAKLRYLLLANNFLDLVIHADTGKSFVKPAADVELERNFRIHCIVMLRHVGV